MAVEELALGKSVTLKPWGLDRYGRLVGMVLLPDGSSLNHELVRAGLARWDRRYPDDALAEVEAQARAAGLGIWSIGKETT